MGKKVRLPKSLIKEQSGAWNWADKSLCRQVGPLLFDDSDDESAVGAPAVAAVRLAAARPLCQVCPVFAECAEHALQSGEPQGVWAGLTRNERIEIRRAADDVMVRVKLAEARICREQGDDVEMLRTERINDALAVCEQLQIQVGDVVASEGKAESQLAGAVW